MCHPLMLSKVETNIVEFVKECAFKLIVTVKCEGKTGVEMEALSGVSIGLLTIYDMIKAIDKSMRITDIVLESKEGGKSGNLCDLKKEPQINYPTFWDYKVIFEVHIKASEIFEEILGQREYKFEHSNSSASGKYQSYLLNVYVDSKKIVWIYLIN